MGGLRRVMPITARTYFIACLAITAAPIPFFAGFWSKDEILWKAFTTENTGFVPGALVYVMGLAAALGTSFYMWRSYYLTFEGPHATQGDRQEGPRVAAHHHRRARWCSPCSPRSRASSSASPSTSSATRTPSRCSSSGSRPCSRWARAQTHFEHERASGSSSASWPSRSAGAIGAWALARSRYGADRSPDWAAEERTLPGFTLMQNKYYVDEIYQGSIVKWFMALRLVLAEMDTWIVDGLVNGIAVVVRTVSWINGAIDHYLVDGLVNFVAEGTLAAGRSSAPRRPGASRTTCTASWAASPSSPSSSTSSGEAPRSLPCPRHPPIRFSVETRCPTFASTVPSTELRLKLLGSLLLAPGARARARRTAARAPRPRSPRAQAPAHAPAPAGRSTSTASAGTSTSRSSSSGPTPSSPGTFEIENVGGGPLHVTRVAVRTSPTDPRTPPGVTVELEGGGQQAIIAPRREPEGHRQVDAPAPRRRGSSTGTCSSSPTRSRRAPRSRAARRPSASTASAATGSASSASTSSRSSRSCPCSGSSPSSSPTSSATKRTRTSACSPW